MKETNKNSKFAFNKINYILLGVGVFTVSFIIALFNNLESWILMIFVGVYILIGLLRHILFQNSDEELELTGENK